MALDLMEFVRTAKRIWQNAQVEGRLIYNPLDQELKDLVAREPGIRQTKYGNFVAESEPTSRSAMFTRNSVDNGFGDDERRLLIQCEQVLAQKQLICIDRVVGTGDSGTTVRLIIPVEFAHIAYGGGHLFLPTRTSVETPTYQIIFFSDEAFATNKSKPLPQKDITIRLAFLPDGRFIKIIRNGNYIGEYKKGVFAAENWVAKTRRGGIFLHAGCREDYLQSTHGDYRMVRTLFVALSANGKTTLTSRILARKGNEQSWLIQDDGGTLMPDGSFRGFEAGGIFVKTEGVNPGEQREIYYGLLRPDTLAENVYLTDDGDFDFYNIEITSNGRAVIRRRDFMHTSQHIAVGRVDNLILITRGPLISAISKLTLEQAAALMVVGQAMESSAGDPTRAGKIKSEFFYDPFVVGDRAEHANRFYEILRGLPYSINCYLINTGGIGEREHYKDITLDHTLGILDSLLRGGLEDWVDSPAGFPVPRAVRTVDEIYFHPEKFYSRSEFEERQKELNRIRRKAVAEIGDALHQNIRRVFA